MSKFFIKCCLIFFLTGFSCYGQNHTIIDNLNSKAYELRFYEPDIAFGISMKAMQLAGKDTLQSAYVLSLRNAGISKFALSDYDYALSLIQRALSIAELIEDSVSMSACHNNLFIIYKAQGKVRQAKQHIISSIEIDISLKDTAGIASGLNHLAEFYYNDGQTKEALSLYTRSATLAQKADDPVGASDAFNNIATVYYQVKNYQLALLYYQKSYEIYKAHDYATGIAMTLGNMANTLADMGKGAEALTYVEESISIYEKINDQRGLTQSYIVKAIALQSMGNVDEAEEIFYKAMNMAMEVGNYVQLANGFSSQALFYLSQKDTITAIQLFQNCLEFSRELEYGVLIVSSLEHLVKLNEGIRNFEKALAYFKELHAYDKNKEILNPAEKQLILTAQAIPDLQEIRASQHLIFITIAIVFSVVSMYCILLIFRIRKLKTKLHTENHELRAGDSV